MRPPRSLSHPAHPARRRPVFYPERVSQLTPPPPRLDIPYLLLEHGRTANGAASAQPATISNNRRIAVSKPKFPRII